MSKTTKKSTPTPKDSQYYLASVVENRLKKIRETLVVKGKEYVRGTNRFHNFDRGSEMNRTTPTRALHGYLSKHLVSYLDMLDDIDNGVLISDKVIEEKIGDIMVYFALQEALIKARYGVK